MALGVLIGATVFPEWLKSINEKCTLVSTVFLIFTMGVMLGSRDSFLDELVTLGLSSILFCIVPVICSIICVYVLTRLCMKDIIARHEHDAQTKDDSSSNGEVVMIVSALCALVFGVLYGLSHVHLGVIDFVAYHSTEILYILMFFVGISVGTSRGLIAKIRQYHIRTFIIPFGIMFGSIVGGIIVAPLCGVSCATGGAIASGLGWYSLSGVMITDIAGAHIGSITFMSNLMRELISFFSIPWIAKHLNYPTCIAPAGATSEDTTLPMMIRCTNEETVVLSVLNGIICSAAVPVLIEIFHSFM